VLPKPFELNVLKELAQQRYDVLKELGDSYTQAGKYEKAGPCYDQAIALRPDLPDAFVSLGLLAVHAGHLELGEEVLRRAVEIDPGIAEAYGGLAVIHQRRQDFPAAFDMYLKSLELDTDNLLALLGLFQTSCKMGTFAKIIYYLELYLEKHPDDTAVLFCLGTLYARDGRLEEARELLIRLLNHEPDKPEAASLLEKVENLLAPAETEGIASP
jgi:tetratricopeptide (TPR) repeat protein